MCSVRMSKNEYGKRILDDNSDSTSTVNGKNSKSSNIIGNENMALPRENFDDYSYKSGPLSPSTSKNDLVCVRIQCLYFRPTYESGISIECYLYMDLGPIKSV